MIIIIFEVLILFAAALDNAFQKITIYEKPKYRGVWTEWESWSEVCTCWRTNEVIVLLAVKQLGSFTSIYK